MSFYVGGILFLLALFGSVASLVSRVLMRHGRPFAAARLGTAGFCATVLVTAAAAAIASLTSNPYSAAFAAILVFLAIRDYRFLEKLPREDASADQAADGTLVPRNGGK